MAKNEDFVNLIGNLMEEKKALKELEQLFNNLKNAEAKEEKSMISSQINNVQNYFRTKNAESGENLDKISLSKPLRKKEAQKPVRIETKSVKIIATKKEKIPTNIKLTGLEKETLKRLRGKEEKKEKEKTKKASKFAKTSNNFFGDISNKLIKKDFFAFLEKDLMKTSIELTPQSYISVMIFITVIALGVSFFIFLFLLIFSLKDFPVLSLATEGFLARFPKVFWVMIIIPIITFIFMYFYPSLERRSAETKINQELPFAVIHMSTISGAMVEPSKIFSIIMSTKEYPNLQPQFTKLLNFINIYGYDLVNALRKVGSTSPSRKLADLFNSLAVTINSGGSLVQFFNKRADSLLFEYKLDREKYIKFSETFMDIYISAVIAAPMMLMLLLMMMKISGLGLSLSSGMISFIMVMAVSVINIVFLVFLHIKQQGE
jgi:hypothetical protein